MMYKYIRGIMRLSFQAILLFMVTLFSYRCVNDCSKAVQFEMPINIFPYKTSYNVYDTLWVEFSIPTILEDKLTLEQIHVGFHNFQVKMDIIELLDSFWVDGTHNVQ